MAANDTTDPEIGKIIGLIKEYTALYNFGTEAFNRGRLEHLYKRDEDFTAYDVAPPVGGYIGWKAYAKGWDHLLGKFSQFNFEINDDLRVFRRGEVAWASMSCATSGKSADGAPFRKELRLTLNFVNDDGKWLIVHEHCSTPRMFELPNGTQV
jgi:ketosteroid isomerase-like protein